MTNFSIITTFINSLLKEQGYSGKVAPSTSLILSGLLDSLAVVQIVVFLEKEFDIDFSDLYFDQTSFDSLDKIVTFIEDYQSSQN